MLLSRLTLAFAVLILLSAVQAAFSVWAVRSASAQSALTRDAQQMLTEYQALAANKQRLLVWLAGAALTGQGSVEQRAQLLREMDRSLGELERLQTQPAFDRLRTAATAAAGAQPPSGQPLSPRYMQPGVQPIPLLRANFEAMQAYVLQASAAAERSPASDQALMWLQAATVFDHHGGRDMRQVLATAVEQQRDATEQAMAQQSQALTTLQRSSMGLVLLSALWGLLAAGYFVRRLHRPRLGGCCNRRKRWPRATIGRARSAPMPTNLPRSASSSMRWPCNSMPIGARARPCAPGSMPPWPNAPRP